MLTSREKVEVAVERGMVRHTVWGRPHVVTREEPSDFIELYVENKSDPQESSTAELTLGEARDLAHELLRLVEEIGATHAD